MKRALSIFVIALFGISLLFQLACGREDTTSPVITLKGYDIVYVEHGVDWTDPGFTAFDDTEGELTSRVSVSGTVNVSLARTYTLIYSVEDAAGNKGTTTRTVIVRHTKNSIQGSYSTTESCTISGNKGPYACSIIPRTVNEFAIKLNNFGDFPTTIDLDAELSGENGLEVLIPQQIITGISFTGSGTIGESGTEITFTYTADDGVDSETCTATWTKQ